jgi:hypothetical protein
MFLEKLYHTGWKPVLILAMPQVHRCGGHIQKKALRPKQALLLPAKKELKLATNSRSSNE